MVNVLSRVVLNSLIFKLFPSLQALRIDVIQDLSYAFVLTGAKRNYGENAKTTQEGCHEEVHEEPNADHHNYYFKEGPELIPLFLELIHLWDYTEQPEESKSKEHKGSQVPHIDHGGVIFLGYDGHDVAQ